MGSWVLPSHALPCHPTALPSPAPHPRLALSVSPRPSLVPKRLPFAWAAASCTPTAARRNGTLAVVQAAEGDAVVEVAEALGDEPEEEETDGVSEDEELPRKPIVKLGDIMGILHTRAIEASEKERPVPDLRTGDIVQIKLEVPENRRRVSIYKGIVMSKQNAGIHTTIRIRRIIAGIGVEIVFPVYSPNIKEIKVVKHRKVRRARLYYLRDKLPRLSTFN